MNGEKASTNGHNMHCIGSYVRHQTLLVIFDNEAIARKHPRLIEIGWAARGFVESGTRSIDRLKSAAWIRSIASEWYGECQPLSVEGARINLLTFRHQASANQAKPGDLF